ncbi:MAG: TVP38/TMEM64 family protein [Halocynthiibacter sp.]
MHADDAQTTNKMTRYLVLGVLALIFVLGIWKLGDYFSFETLRTQRMTLEAFRNDHYGISVLVFVAAYVVVVGFSLPGGTLMTLMGGFLFGTFPGVFFNVIGATLGAAGLFSVLKWGGGKTLAAKMNASSGRIGQVKDGIDKNQWTMLFLIRLVPILPFWVANIIPALVGVPLSRYVITTFFGVFPATLVFTSIGAGLGSVFDAGGTPDLSVIFSLKVLGPLLGLAALSLLPVVLRPLMPKKENKNA